MCGLGGCLVCYKIQGGEYFATSVGKAWLTIFVAKLSKPINGVWQTAWILPSRTRLQPKALNSRSSVYIDERVFRSATGRVLPVPVLNHGASQRLQFEYVRSWFTAQVCFGCNWPWNNIPVLLIANCIRWIPHRFDAIFTGIENGKYEMILDVYRDPAWRPHHKTGRSHYETPRTISMRSCPCKMETHQAIQSD